MVNAYAIAFAGFMLLGGRAGDLYGRKRMFLVGLALFTVASLGGGLAQAGWQLLVARAAQGLGAAVLAPSTLTILTSASAEAERTARGPSRPGRRSAPGAGRLGGLVGGLPVDGLSWRWVLLINVPVGAVVLAGAARWLVESRAGDGRRLDLPGALLVTAGLATLAYGIVQTEAEGRAAAATLVPLCAGLALIGLFLLVEARTRVPLMPLRLLGVRAVASANAAMFVCGSAMFCMWFFMTLYAQNMLGYSPLGAGLALVPLTGGGPGLETRTAAHAGGRGAQRRRHRVAGRRGGLRLAVDDDGRRLLPDGDHLPGVLMMAGAGLAATPLASLATSGAAPGDAGLVSGLVNASRTMGGSLGLAVMSTIAASRTGSDSSAPALTAGYALAFRTGGYVLLGGAVLMLLWLPSKISAR